MSKRVKAIILNKGTLYENLTPEEIAAKLPNRLPDVYQRRLLESHEIHLRALGDLRASLDALGWDYEVVHRDDFKGAGDADLVMSLGGDGTVLSASHKLIGTPLLGVNSDPARSTGYFCATTISGLTDTLKRFEAGDLVEFVLHRLRLKIDGKVAGPPALNDILVANANPAATSRYVLIAGPRAEEQKSSGVWISTPAGSTAGIRSAGGVVLPLSNPQLQYLVREPVFIVGQKYELLRGVRDLDEGLTVVSYMADGCAYIDGPFEQVPLPKGTTMRVSAHEPLTLLGLEPERRER